MGDFLQTRLQYLRQSQNADGGWGYFRGKKSWLEPSFYAAVALHGEPASERAFALLRTWQTEDGSWRPNAEVPDGGWCTALMVTLHCIRGVYDEKFEKGVNWLVGSSGAENALLPRIWQYVRPGANELDFSLQGWPWLPTNSSWVEPTAHALVALKKAAAVKKSPKLASRIAEGEKLLLDRRCSDGGWNYGNKKVLNTMLPSYPETTAIGLLGLLGASSGSLAPSLVLAKRYWAESKPGMARAWLSVTLRNHGVSDETNSSDVPLSPDHLIVALEALGAPDGGFRRLNPKQA